MTSVIFSPIGRRRPHTRDWRQTDRQTDSRNRRRLKPPMLGRAWMRNCVRSFEVHH